MNPFSFASHFQRAMAGLINRKTADDPKLTPGGVRTAISKGGVYVVRPSRIWPNKVVVTEVQSLGVDSEGDNLILTTSARGVKRKTWQTVDERDIIEDISPEGMTL